MAYTTNTFNYGSAFANLPVVILETAASTNPGAGAIIMVSATTGVLSTTGQATLDANGSLTVFLDNTKTFAVTLLPAQSGLYQLPTSNNYPASLNVSSVAYGKSLIIKPAAGRLLSVTVHNSNVAAQFIQLHDSVTLPADTAVPVYVRSIPAASSVSFGFDLRGRSFANGIVICSSSTGPTKTLGGANDVWFDAQYL